MTDSLEADLQDNIPVDEVISEKAPENNSAEKEDVLNKSIVQKIIARERKKAYEKGKQEALMSIEQSDVEATPVAQQRAPQTFGGIPQMSHDDIQKMIAEQIPQHLEQQVQEHKNRLLVDSFVGKMKAAESRYPGLEEKLNDLDYSRPATRAIVEMANNMENTGDIMNELVTNPEKMGVLLNLVYEQPKMAMQRMMSLSNSIKQNQEALAQEKSAQNPIGQMKSSANAGISSRSEHDLSVNDLRKMFKR